MKHSFHAALLDLDGTLADTLEDLANATNHALAALGCPTHPADNYRLLVGDGARTLCSRALPVNRQELVDETLRLMREHYEAHRYDRTRLYDGIADLVTSLRERKVRLAVLSNKPDRFTCEMVDRYFAPATFDVVRGQRANVPLKPDPSAALQIAQELDIPPSRWLYLGDTNTDMRTARAAGMFAVGVLWGFRDREELMATGAQTLVSTPGDVLNLL